MSIVFTVIAALVGGSILHKLGVPGGALIGSMLGVAIIRLVGLEVVEANSTVRFFAYIAIGWVLSQGLDRGLISELRAAWVPILAIVVALPLFGALLAVALWGTGQLDPMTALLATAPGGIAQMGVLGAELGGNVGLITSIHVLRITTVLLAAPLVARALA